MRFSSGAWVMGVLAEKSPGPLAWLRFEGPVAFAWDGVIPRWSTNSCAPRAIVIVTGALADGQTLDRLDGAVLDRYRMPGSDRHRFEFFSGAVVEGRLERSVRDRHDRLLHLELSDARIAARRSPVDRARRRYRLVAAGDPLTAHAGAVDPSYHGETAFPGVRVPKPRTLPDARAGAARALRTGRVWPTLGASELDDCESFPRVHDALARSFPDEWLLRWNLLESLLKAARPGRPLSGSQGRARAARGGLRVPAADRFGPQVPGKAARD